MKFWRKKPQPEPARQDGIFRTHPLGPIIEQRKPMTFAQPGPMVASDSAAPILSAQGGFFEAGAGFVGYHTCAMLATNWLIDKCCSVPARDAIRNGYTLNEEAEQLRGGDTGYGVTDALRELIHFGRIYGGRVVLFEVDGLDYSAPFNIDGVAPGSYRGMSQVDPNWAQPVLTGANLSDPAARDYYRPDFWRVGNRVIHRSHLHIFVPSPVPDFLKPTYNFMGVPLPQRLVERVYAAERSANELPLLLMSKRTTVLQLADSALGNWETLRANLQEWIATRDNFGVKVSGPDESIQQFDTSITEVDQSIMTQYQLVASVANIPATKLFGVQPRGFNATGEYEGRSYREELESIQSNDLSALLVRHYTLQARSQGVTLAEPVSVQWASIDSPTAAEWAQIEKTQADRDAVLFGMGAIDAEDVRNRIRGDRESDYHGIEEGVVQQAEATSDEWITVHPNGPGTTGTPVEIDETGTVLKGMGGKFTGQKISEARKGFTGPKTANRGTLAAGSGSSPPASARHPSLSSGHHQFNEPRKIVRETEKAVAVSNPEYEQARETARYDVKELSGRQIQMLREKKDLIWMPKSQVSTSGGEVVGAAAWLAQREGIKTIEGESRRKDAFAAGAQRYQDLLAKAKAAGVPGVRERMKTETIKQKMRAHGVQVDSSDHAEDEGLDFMAMVDGGWFLDEAAV